MIVLILAKVRIGPRPILCQTYAYIVSLVAYMFIFSFSLLGRNLNLQNLRIYPSYGCHLNLIESSLYHQLVVNRSAVCHFCAPVIRLCHGHHIPSVILVALGPIWWKRLNLKCAMFLFGYFLSSQYRLSYSSTVLLSPLWTKQRSFVACDVVELYWRRSGSSGGGSSVFWKYIKVFWPILLS